MDSKTIKKLSTLALTPKQVIKNDKCSKLKGGGYYCCTRNKWIR